MRRRPAHAGTQTYVKIAGRKVDLLRAIFEDFATKG